MSNGEVDAEEGADAGALAGEHELHRSVDTVAVGQRERVHAVVGGAFDERVRVRCAVPERVAGRDVQMHEGIGQRGLVTRR